MRTERREECRCGGGERKFIKQSFRNRERRGRKKYTKTNIEEKTTEGYDCEKRKKI